MPTTGPSPFRVWIFNPKVEKRERYAKCQTEKKGLSCFCAQALTKFHCHYWSAAMVKETVMVTHFQRNDIVWNRKERSSLDFFSLSLLFPLTKQGIGHLPPPLALRQNTLYRLTFNNFLENFTTYGHDPIARDNTVLGS
ncbi:hypothetical protein TIFTF001_019927 [Ficus carica]|uniref:Uncharacterized protein n=1 Tax=Ficus carica TaxID=3494 RepID=A0AA88DC54_FICCA|nr:hypothetical protein TIFTF001_019927 [Ficus carica]